jgi:antitoxin HicB
MKAPQTWMFPAEIVEHGPGDVSVSFPDVPEAITGGVTLAVARAQAADALEEAILGRLANGEAIPSPRAARAGEESIVLDPVTAARAALAQAMAAERLTNTALARRLGKTEGAVRRLTSGEKGVKLDTVLEALAEVGRKGVFALV